MAGITAPSDSHALQCLDTVHMYTHGRPSPSGTSSFDTRYASSVACMHANSAPGHILVVILPESRISALVELVRLGLIGRRNPERIALPTPSDGRPQICGEQGRAPRGCVAPGSVCPPPRARPVLSHRRPAAPKRGACWTPARSHRQPAVHAGSSARTWHRVHGQARLLEKLARLHPNMCTWRTFRTTPSHALSETSTITLAPRPAAVSRSETP